MGVLCIHPGAGKEGERCLECTMRYASRRPWSAEVGLQARSPGAQRSGRTMRASSPDHLSPPRGQSDADGHLNDAKDWRDVLRLRFLGINEDVTVETCTGCLRREE